MSDIKPYGNRHRNVTARVSDATREMARNCQVRTADLDVLEGEWESLRDEKARIEGDLSNLPGGPKNRSTRRSALVERLNQLEHEMRELKPKLIVEREEAKRIRLEADPNLALEGRLSRIESKLEEVLQYLRRAEGKRRT